MLERVARYGNDFAEERKGPGILTRVLGAITRNPLRSVSVLVIVLGTGAIVVNAAFFQTGEHPSPLFSTRNAPVATAEPAAPALAATPETTEVAAPPPAAPRVDEVARLVEATPVAPPVVPTTPASPDVAEVQRLLTDLGYQPGTVDGLFGARTRSAIEAYQGAEGMAVTGEINDDLLTRLRASAAGPAAAPATAEAATPAPAATVQSSETARILAVQTALNQAGFGPIPATGTVSIETTAAIRRFQLDQGLTPTGEIDAALVARMTAIGALQ